MCACAPGYVCSRCTGDLRHDWRMLHDPDPAEVDRDAREAAESAQEARAVHATSYDRGLRRRAVRAGRDKGCRVYIPAEELRRAGIDPDGPAPFYRTAGFQRSAHGHTVIVSLYQER